MKDFTFYNPTRIEFGKGKENLIGSYVGEFGSLRVLLLYGSERIRRDGLFERVTRSLDEQGIAWEALGGVVSNPRLGLVREAIALVRKKGLQGVVAVGGGSVLDSAKAVAAGAPYDGDVWDFFIGRAAVEKALPVFAIMTLAATGSEMNSYGVVTNEATSQKYAIGSPLLHPKVSVINPELMASVSPAYLAYSAVDIFAHCLDLYFTAEYLPDYNAALIENILHTVMRTTAVLLDNPADYAARAEFAWASTMALNGLTFVGVSGNGYDTHMIEHAMSALYDVAHGAGLAVVLPAWMRWYQEKRPQRFVRFAEKMFAESNGEAGIDRLRRWFKAIGAPVTLAELGIPESGLTAVAENAYGLAENWGIADQYPVAAIVDILRLARE
jgi:alcohol dehydrogenase YqhD (iron-dependent ADH family)